MKRFLFILLTFLCVNSLFAQEPEIGMRISTRDDDTRKNLPGATIEIYQDGKLVKTLTTDSKGRVPVQVFPVNHLYVIKYKKAGYVTKVANVDARFDTPEDLEPYTEIQLEAGIFKKVEGFDFAFLEKQPMITWEFSPEGYIKFDEVALKQKLKRIEELKEEMEKKKEELEKLEEEKKKQEADFNAYVKAGDNAANKDDLETAIEQYELALKIKDDPTVRSRMENVKKQLADREKQQQIDKEFADKMQAAKSALDAKKYEQAIQLYTAASKLKPNEQLPKDQIAAIQKILDEQKAQAEKFNKLVADGDAAMTAKNYDSAIEKYTAAIAIKDEAAVRTKLENAKKLKAEAEKKAKEEAEKEERYLALIGEADKFYDSENYASALAKYKEALTVKPGESHPTNRIADINKKLEEIKANEEAEKKKEADYTKAMNEANAFYDQGKWTEAKAKYQAALKIKPGEAEPTNKIDEINKKLAAEEEKKKKDAEYTAALNKANELFNQKKYEEAKSQYNLALGVKPNELEPKQQIKKIDDILAQQKAEAEAEKAYQDAMKQGNAMFANEDYLNALNSYKKALELKPTDADVKAKIELTNQKIKEKSEAAEKEKEFQKFLLEGDKLFSNKDYQNAKMNYQKAYAIKKDPIVEEKIKHMDKLIADTQSAAELDAKFQKAIKEADALYAANDYEAALAKYQEAKSYKESAHADERINDINKKLNAAKQAEEKAAKIIALNDEAAKYYADNKLQLALDKYKESYALKPDPEINKKIIEIQNRISEENKNKSTQQAYQDKIDLADAKFKEGDWQQAIGYYQQAKQVKSDETYPDSQIAICQKKMQEESANEAEESYKKIVAKGDEYFNAKNYDEAISYYNRALGIKKDDPYPKAQIAAIQKIKDDAAKQLNEQDKKDQAYNDLVKSADVLFTAKNYQAALDKYKEALIQKPTDSYVANQIKLAEKAIKDLNEKDATNEKYLKIIAEADALMKPGSWADAKAKYEAALLIKPTETYPITQIDKCNAQMTAESGTEEEKNYQKILTVAQKKMDAGEYDRALELFTRANGIRPSDPLPIRKIQEINQILANAKNKNAYQELIDKADALFEKQEWKAARPLYVKAYAINNDSYPDEQIKKIDAQTKEFDQKQYNKMIVKADEYFRDENYEKAKGLYLRAIKFQPTWDNSYPKSQLQKIKSILNPPQATNNGVRNAGDKVVGKTEQDMASMFADAEEQRKFNNTQKVVNQNDEHVNYKNDWDEREQNATNKAKDLTDEIVEDINEQVLTAEEQRKKAELAAQKEQEEYNDAQSEIAVYNEHVIFRQKEVVTNLETEINENKTNADIPRQEFEGEVVNVKTNIDTQTDINANHQTNEIYDNKNYVNHVQETHVTQDPNMDVNRKNTEVKVVDMKVVIVNEENKNSWAQEDAIMDVKSDVDLMIDEQNASRVNSDLARQDTEDKVVDIESDNTTYHHNLNRRNIDVSYDVKGYADHVQEQIVIDNMANDVPRQKMEDEKVRIEDAVVEKEIENSTNQELAINNTKNHLNKEVETQNEIFSTKDEHRKQDAEKVVELEDEITTTQNTMQAENQNNSFSTVNYVEKSIEEVNNQNAANEQKTIDNQDATVEAVNDLNAKKVQDAEENQKKVDETSDYITNLKDIDVTKIDVHVKNALGEKYPEGMTQEVYELKDEYGLLLEYTIRRLVVIEGEGNVYEKVQNRSGVSYTKNGKAISEYQWQNETANSNLVRN